MTSSKISLKVEDGYPRDMGRGIIRIDFDSMDTIGASSRDVLEIKGKRKTSAVCLPVYPSDDGKGILRADKITQGNAKVSPGDSVTIQKISKVITKHVTVRPLQEIPPGMETYLKDALETVPLVNGDEIAVRYFEKLLYFKVIKATPQGIVSDQKTKFRIIRDKKSGAKT